MGRGMERGMYKSLFHDIVGGKQERKSFLFYDRRNRRVVVCSYVVLCKAIVFAGFQMEQREGIHSVLHFVIDGSARLMLAI